MRHLLLLGAGLISVHLCIAQQAATPFREISLSDLSAFAPAASNWQIAGRATANRLVEHDMALEPGMGVLANRPSEEARDNLFTEWSHADIELDLEVMMPQGSNSGIYFQSRYEVQLFDSWGVQDAGMGDLGGIYQRWDDSRPEGRQGYEGHPPRVNVARAPGLWQHLNIVFQAPRFDAAGAKVTNARFVKVTLNGVVIHENVEVTGPTRAAAFEDEVARAPIMLQGDHGPVAFRRIRYRQFDTEPVQLSDVTYTYYEGRFDHRMPDLADLQQVSSEPAASITVERAAAQKEFAVQHAGTILIPRSGDYTFEVSHTARFRLYIDANQVLGDNDKNVAGVGEFDRREVVVPLSEGDHTFEITYAKGLWHSEPTALGWYVSGPGVLRSELTAPGSLPADAFGAYRLNPTTEPILQRNFVMHGETARTHAISVGFPGGVHYAYDMSLGTLLHVWKGPFVDTSTMWYERGYMQSAVPIGSVIEQAGSPTILIADENSPGGIRGESAYRFDNYRLDDEGRPAFTYRVGAAEVMDFIEPSPEGQWLTRTLTVDTGGESGLRCVLMENDAIEKYADGIYLVGDQQMYLEMVEGGTPVVQATGNSMQLVLPIAAGVAPVKVQYRLVW